MLLTAENAVMTGAALLRYFCAHFQLEVWKGVLLYEFYYMFKTITAEFGGRKI